MILRDLHLDTGTKICIMINVVLSELEDADAWQGNAKLVQKL